LCQERAVAEFPPTIGHHRLEPFTYLRHLFTALPTAQTVDDYEKLLPWNINRTSLSIG
ncbi:MAG: transposase domain-containing protein, partial [Magnetococcales bacterium]|nr:transposase domain-containing protein [Magnetococcales bacterium]